MKGELVRQLRLERNLTQQEFGDLLNISGSNVRMIELNQRNGSIEVATKVADFFGVSIDYLEGRTEYRNAQEVVDDLLQKIGTVKLTNEQMNAIVEKVKCNINKHN